MNDNKLQHDESMFKGAPAGSFSKAKSLRSNMTKAEIVLWEAIKNNQLEGFKFRRQHPIHNFIVDFYCHKLKLIIEVDGEYHLNKAQQSKDIERTEIIEYQNLKLIRFTNEEVLSNLNNVLERIRKVALN